MGAEIFEQSEPDAASARYEESGSSHSTILGTWKCLQMVKCRHSDGVSKDEGVS